MHVAGLWRYPVKSFQGESKDALEIQSDGVAGDRSYGILDLSSHTVLSAKREGQLLNAFARLTSEGPVLQLPSGSELGAGPDLDDALSEWLGRSARLVAAAGNGPATYQGTSNFEQEDAPLVSWQGPPDRFVDSLPVHLLTTASLRACAHERPDIDWSPRRFRPNVLVEAEGDELVEQDWVGQQLHLGGVELKIEKRCARCVMTTRPQPFGIGRQLEVLRHINVSHETRLGVLATVVRPGSVRLGDEVSVASH